MLLSEAANKALSHPKVLSSLDKALRDIGEEGNKTLSLVNYGGQGLIFRLESSSHSFPLLIKVPFYSRHASMEIAEHGILKEARIAEALTKSGLDVAPTFVALDQNGLYFIREYAEGEELEAHLYRCSEAERDALLLVEYELVKNLFHLFHENKRERYAIRDLKPRNLILGQDGRLRLIDCGSCRPESQMTSKSKEKARQRLGSEQFLHWPLEQFLEDDSCLDRRVDYFAWGVMAYFTLFLTRPYRNDKKDIKEAIMDYEASYKIACEKLESAYRNGRLNKGLYQNIVSCLNPDPCKRRFLT